MASPDAAPTATPAAVPPPTPVDAAAPRLDAAAARAALKADHEARLDSFLKGYATLRKEYGFRIAVDAVPLLGEDGVLRFAFREMVVPEAAA